MEAALKSLNYARWRVLQWILDVAEGTGAWFRRFATEVQLFCRMNWRYLLRRSAYRYTFRIGRRPDGTMVQRNGLILPRQRLPDPDPSIRGDLEAAWKAAGGD